MTFHTPNVIVLCLAGLIAFVVLTVGLINSSNNDTRKKIETHKNAVVACTTLDEDVSISACILALAATQPQGET